MWMKGIMSNSWTTFYDYRLYFFPHENYMLQSQLFIITPLHCMEKQTNWNEMQKNTEFISLLFWLIHRIFDYIVQLHKKIGKF